MLQCYKCYIKYIYTCERNIGQSRCLPVGNQPDVAADH